MAIEPTLEQLVEQAKEGDKTALEALLAQIQNQIYNLALRMLWHPADAEDATQEILIKIITHLSQFRQDSAFTTWVYRLATNHLLTTRKRRAELQPVTFEQFGEELEKRMDLEVAPLSGDLVEQRLLLDEVQLRCTLGMLLCLDREHRIAYILGQILELDGNEGAYITETTPVVFRKRLSRARQRMRGFMESNCGLVNPANPCRCERQLGYKMRYEKLAPNRLLFARAEFSSAPDQPFSESVIRDRIGELKEIDRAVALYRSHPQYAAPDNLLQAIKQLLGSGKFEWFN